MIGFRNRKFSLWAPSQSSSLFLKKMPIVTVSIF